MLIQSKSSKIKTVLAFRCSDAVLFMLINIKMPTIVDILTFMSMIDFMFSGDEHEKFYYRGPKIEISILQL